MNKPMRHFARSSTRGPGVRLVGRILLTLGVLGVIPASAAYAHKMTVFATAQGKTIQGEVYYQDGSPAQNVTVSVLDPATGASPNELAAEIRALNQQIAALRSDLEKWKTALRLQDVLGGVGYILGILGGVSYFLAGRRRNKRSQGGV